MEYLLVFLSGFSVCAVIGGTLWFLWACERAKEFKAMREENEWLRAKDQQRVEGIASIYVRMQEFRLRFGGKVALPATATPKAEWLEVNLQHISRHTRD
jgi:hypothetical protein